MLPTFPVNTPWRACVKFTTCSQTDMSADPHQFDIEWPVLNLLDPFQVVDDQDAVWVLGWFVR